MSTIHWDLPQKFRLKAPMVGIRRAAEGVHIVTLPSGAILTISGDILKSGLVDATYDGGAIAVFMEDVRSRCEEIDKA